MIKIYFFSLKGLIFTLNFVKIIQIIINKIYVEENPLKKLVIKTALITLASLIGAMTIAFGATAICAPGFTAGFFDGVGNYSAAVFFYEKQYQKTSDVDDLVVLVDNIDYRWDLNSAEKYLNLLLAHVDFDDFCAQNQNGFSQKEYYYGNYALVLAKKGKFSVALSVSTIYVNECGYTKYNPYRVLILDYNGATTEQLNQILDKLTALTGSISDTTQQGYLNEDISNLTN